jgi:hypothetical protein
MRTVLVRMLAAVSATAATAIVIAMAVPAPPRQAVVALTSAAAAAPAALPATPRVGVQDGWIERPGTQGCDSNEENDLATPVPPPDYQTTIPTAVDDGSNWTDLNIRYVRITVPWDIAYHHDPMLQVTKNGRSYPLDPNAILQVEQDCLDFWLADINRANAQRAPGQAAIQPEVQFRPDYNDLRIIKGRRRPVIMVPGITTYKKAMQAFFGTYSCATPAGQPEPTCPLPTGIPSSLGVTAMTRVSTITPWGEPDFYSQHPKQRFSGALNGQFYMPSGTRRFDQTNCSTNVNTCGPALAAHMWLTAAALCHGCTVIAGTFGSNPAKTMAYLKVYARDLSGKHPAVWGIDPYTDIENYELECWGNHPPAVAKVGKYPKSPPAPRGPCTAPSKESTLIWKFSEALGNLHYSSRTTRIWLGEISVFYIDSLAHKGKWYGFTVERQAADYLLKQLALPGASTPGGDPYVARFYYMRYEDGSGYPDFALVLDNTGNTKTGPVAPHTEYRVPAYAAFRFRGSPQQ